MCTSSDLSWIPLVATSVVIVFGWFIAHLLTSRRDAANKRREIQVAALRSIYVKLSGANQRPLDAKVAEDIESLVSEIQLYGNERLTSLTATLVEDYKRRTWVSYDALLKELRDQIRQDLSLPKIAGEVWWLRFTKPSGEGKKSNVASAETSNKPDA